MATNQHSYPRQRRASALQTVFDAIIGLVDLIMHPLQNRIGMRGMAYIFVLPNLLIFGIFILLPMLLNFYYAFTGGTNLFPADRPFVGLQNLQRLFDCQNFLSPNTCRQTRSFTWSRKWG
jgi:alpha-1,4-digalacturonate transport system permease protein